jgi:hypothetical protein
MPEQVRTDFALLERCDKLEGLARLSRWAGLERLIGPP